MTHFLLVSTDSTLEDVKKLKVCVELNGLQLNRPRLPRELSQWLPSWDRKWLPVKESSEVTGSWREPSFLRRVAPTGERFLKCDWLSGSLWFWVYLETPQWS